MSIEAAQRNVIGHRQQITRLLEEKSRESARAADSARKASAAAVAATRSSSSSTMQSRMREAQHHQDDAAKHQKRAADCESKIAAEQKRLVDAERKLNYEQAKMSSHQLEEHKKAARERERQMHVISGTLARHSRLNQRMQHVVDKLELLPKRINVLFLASNPRDQQQLSLDEEVRLIAEMIRKSEHRDAVKLESRWALRTLDLLQALNEIKPCVVHFSGHGSDQEEIVFQDDAGRSKFVSKEAIVRTMAATSDGIQLVFFNTCYSNAQAEAVVECVPAAIGMKTSIGDQAARVFASQFYSAIGFGLSVRKAFDQAKAALMLENIPEESTPELFTAHGVDPAQLVLVRPIVSTDPATDNRSNSSALQEQLLVMRSEASRMEQHATALNAGFYHNFYDQYLPLKFRPELLEAAFAKIVSEIEQHNVLISNINMLRAAAIAADSEADRVLQGGMLVLERLRPFVLQVASNASQAVSGINRILNSME